MTGKLGVIRIDDTLNVFDEESRPLIMAQAESALKGGKQIRWEDGTIEWVETYQRIDAAKSGSARYTWDKHGDKVLADVIRVTRTPAGKTAKRKIGIKYVAI